MKSNLSLLLLLFPLAALAGEETVTARFRAAAPGLSPLAVACPGAKPSTVEIPEGGRSGLHSYRGAAEAAFHDAAGGRVFPVRFPAVGASPLLVVLTMSESGAPTARVVKDDLDSIPPGGLCFLNVGDRPVEVIVAETRHLLGGGEKATVSSNGRPTAFIRVIDPGTGETLFSNNWGLPAKTRTLVLLEARSDSPQKLALHRLTDSEVPKK